MGNTPAPSPPDLFIIPIGDAAMEKAYLWSSALALEGIETDTDFRGKRLKSLMKRADRLGAAFVLIAGEKELETNELILRNMATKDQVMIDAADPVAEITRFFTRRQRPSAKRVAWRSGKKPE